MIIEINDEIYTKRLSDIIFLCKVIILIYYEVKIVAVLQVKNLGSF